MKRQYLFLTFCITLTIQTQAQIASYNFDTDLSDSISGNDAVFFGSSSFLTDDDAQVLQFDADEYAILPDAVHESIDPTQTFGYSVRFKITDDHVTNPYNGETGVGRRVIISNKLRDLRDKGFDLYFGPYFESETFNLIATYGAGTYDDGGLDTHLDILLNNTAEVGDWVDLTVKFYLDAVDPHIEYIFNNTVVTGYFNPDFTIDSLKKSLNTQEIYLGTDLDNNVYEYQGPFAQMNVDQVEIYNPLPPGDSSKIQNVLETFIAQMNGDTTLTEEEENMLTVDFISNWDDDTYQANDSLVLDYLRTYDMQRGTVFDVEDFDVYEPSSFEPEQNIQYIMEQWMADNLYEEDNVLNMEGISFLDHEVFPGPVSASAPRVENLEILLDGDYNTDPGFHLNDQARVVRPMGYYAAAGELVKITVPTSMVGQGIKIRVGAHNNNLAEVNQSFNRFPRVSKDYDINSTSVHVINPFGGSLYIILPDGSNHGPVSITIDGAVKTPYYCTKAGFETSLSDFIQDVENNYTGWVEFESAKYMGTFPRPEDYDFSTLDYTMDNWDKSMDAFNIVSGRPLDRFRSEYLLMDRQNWAGFTIAPAANPMFFLADYGAPIPIPMRMENPDTFNGGHVVEGIFHELGHLHNMPTLKDEVEANVHIPKAAAWNIFFGDDLDEAFKYCGSQHYTRDQAAIDWFLVHPFRMGMRIGWDPYNIPGDLIQYQARGYARNIEIVALYGWDTLGNINGHYYQEGLDDPDFDPYKIGDDDFIHVSSQESGKNLAPLFELWGVLPSDSLLDILDSYEHDPRIKDRILHYRSIIPRNLSELETFSQSLVAVHDMYWWDTWEGQRYENMLDFYDETVADSIIARMDHILCAYYNTNCELTDIDVLLESSGISLLPNPTDGRFEIVGVMENYLIDIVDISGVTVRSIHYTGNSHFIDLTELPAGMLFIQIRNEDDAQIYLEKILKY